MQMFMTDVIPEVAPRMFALGCSNLRVHVRKTYFVTRHCNIF